MEMETPLIAETVALTEKKVAMALDDIIKLSKRNTNVNKAKKLRRAKNKNQNSNGAARNNTSKGRHYVSSLSAVRKGAVAKRRSHFQGNQSHFQGNQFPVTTKVVRKEVAAAAAPPLSIRGRASSAGRLTSSNQSRRIAPQVQNRYVHAGFIAEGQERKTLDSRFAVMKEQRKSNKDYGTGAQFPRLPPWTRRMYQLKNTK